MDSTAQMLNKGESNKKRAAGCGVIRLVLQVLFLFPKDKVEIHSHTSLHRHKCELWCPGKV